MQHVQRGTNPITGIQRTNLLSTLRNADICPFNSANQRPDGDPVRLSIYVCPLCPADRGSNSEPVGQPIQPTDTCSFCSAVPGAIHWPAIIIDTVIRANKLC